MVARLAQAATPALSTMPTVKSPSSSARTLRSLGSLAVALWMPANACGADVLVAVAANFIRPAERIIADFSKKHDGEMALVAGSTGKLYAQIRSGAPFDVFLAADRRRPALLEEEGLGVAGSRFTYALGRLALWTAREDTELNADTLRRGSFRKLAIANPELAPYGEAAKEVLTRLGTQVQERIVTAESVGQAFALAATGNADLGLVAAPQAQRTDHGSTWLVPVHLHEPIRQDAILLTRAKDNDTATAFVAFLQTDARALIGTLGYGVE